MASTSIAVVVYSTHVTQSSSSTLSFVAVAGCVDVLLSAVYMCCWVQCTCVAECSVHVLLCMCY